MKTFATFVLIALFASLATAYAGAVRSRKLRRQFESLGQIPGRSMEEIIKHVGKPSAREKIHAGREMLQWRRINFQVILAFTNGICDGVDYESGP